VFVLTASGILFHFQQVASIFAMMLMILCIVISYGVVEAWCGFTKNLGRCQGCVLKLFACLRHWILLPIFILLVVMTLIFSMVFIIGSTATADVCEDTPDKRIEGVLLKYGDLDNAGIIAQFLLFYIQGCPEGASPGNFVVKITDVLDVLGNTIAFAQAVLNDTAIPDDTATAIPDICGIDPVTFFASPAVDAFGDTLCDLGTALVDLQLFFSCNNWRPLYRYVPLLGDCVRVCLSLTWFLTRSVSTSSLLS